MKWIKSHDLRLVPDRLLEKAQNPEFDPEAFKKVAAGLVGNPFSFCLYGLDEQGIIQEAVYGHIDPVDHCVWLEESFTLAAFPSALQGVLKEMRSAYKALKIKITESRSLELEG